MLPSLHLYPIRNWNDQKTQAPAVDISIADLIQRLQGCYQLTTMGKLGAALDKFRSLLLNIPLLVVKGLQMELFRKDLPKDKIEDQ
ncbi:unnamed protein product [Orchesella dallaii]|uniref:Coatomer alpha subunit C-terminal domain-containing protein n=1 Tax=Orchesella dallaii TaxID=48710 RepID=A0ABP1RAN1_9HEXA